MKVIIQIPCYNEGDYLPITLRGLPREIIGVKTVEWMVIDDGSHDHTLAVARRLGVDHCIALPAHQGLGGAFRAGVQHCLKLGADVVVNTDADNQYPGDQIASLVAPILRDEADMIIGTRPLYDDPELSPVKRSLHRIGNSVVRAASGTSVVDCRSGFRAFNRRAAAHFRLESRYTYTIETILQAAQAGLRVGSVPIPTNRETRPSRLIQSISSDVIWCAGTIVRQTLRRRKNPDPESSI